jgi:hypothetical protein
LTVFLVASVAVLTIVTVVLAGTTVELLRAVEQLRAHIGLEDKPSLLDISSAVGQQPSNFGLPQVLDDIDRAVVLILSDRCASCRAIAAEISGDVPDDVFILLEEGRREDSGKSLQVRYDFPSSRTIIDYGGGIAGRLGIDTTPAGVVVRQGRVVSARTVPSARQIVELRALGTSTTQTISG